MRRANFSRPSDSTDVAILDAVWSDAQACRKCLHDAALANSLDPDTYLAFPTVGVLPPGARNIAYVVVGSEPSADWVKTRAHALERIGRGLRNLADGPENICLQYALERWLITGDEGYYLTDLAKCTVPVRVAAATRERRYSLCEPFLAREVELTAPRAIVTIGLDAYRYLRDHRRSTWPPIISLLHFAKTAVAYRRQLLSTDWQSSAPSLGELEAFARKRQLPLHAGRATGLRAAHLDLVGAYRTQLDVVRRLLRDEPVSRHEAMVHVAGP